MANLRIIYDNAIDRAATLIASTTAGSLAVTNLRTDIKGAVWRSTGTSVTLEATWATPVTLGGVIAAFANLTSTATIRVRGYAKLADVGTAIDTGAVKACAYAPFGKWAWGLQPLGVNGYRRGGVNTFPYGGGAYGRAWFAQTLLRKITIDIVDTDNPDGYIEVGRLVAGAYWSPQDNADLEAKVMMRDASQSVRTDAGGLRTDLGPRQKALTIDLTLMPALDRARLWGIMRDNAMQTPVFFSLMPESPDPAEEQMYQIYGSLTQQSTITYQFVNASGAPLEMEEM